MTKKEIGIRKDSYLYKIAYSRIWKTREQEKEINNSNLCSFCHKIVFSILVTWPIIGVIIIVYYAMFLIIVIPIGFLFGARKPIFSDEAPDSLTPIEHWPMVCGHRIIPILPILAIGIILGFIKWKLIVLDSFANAFSWIIDLIVLAGSFFVGTIIVTTWIQIILGLVILITALIFIGEKIDFWKLFFVYLKAKKDKICPPVVFIETPK